VGGASPFVNQMTDGIVQAFGPGGVSDWPTGLIKAFGAIKPYGDDPELDVQGKIISAPTKTNPSPPTCTPNEQGGIDLLLEGEFFGSEWGAGTVTATNSASPAVPEQASVGFDSVSVGHFGPWPCATTTRLTATAPQGYHFDRWMSTDGLCSLGGPTCTVPITNRAYNMTAYFAPTVYQLTVNGGQPPQAGRIEAGGGNGYLYPGIDCGSQPNGPTTNTETECQSGAQAMRNDQDITRLNITADDPGPGNMKYAIAGLSGCDSTVIASSLNGQIYSEQCFLDVTSDKTVTATFAAVGPAD
jgi:Divergent InlB B-repeat domain